LALGTVAVAQESGDDESAAPGDRRHGDSARAHARQDAPAVSVVTEDDIQRGRQQLGLDDR
jgi:outer membrane receptor for ferrienterochelin and colicin